MTTVVSGMVTGQLYGQRTGSFVTSGFAWKVAAVLTLVAMLLAAGIMLMFKLAGAPVFPVDVTFDTSIWFMIITFSALLVFLITRFSFRFGVKMGVKVAPTKDKSEIFD